MGIDWNNFLNEQSPVDTASVKIDKWNQSAKKYKDNRTGNSSEMYDYGNTTLVTDRTRVYKGGSWKDRAYWLVPGTRRYLDQDQATDAIGFRCAMDRMGAPSSNLKENQRRGTDYSQKKMGTNCRRTRIKAGRGIPCSVQGIRSQGRSRATTHVKTEARTD